MTAVPPGTVGEDTNSTMQTRRPSITSSWTSNAFDDLLEQLLTQTVYMKSEFLENAPYDDESMFLACLEDFFRDVLMSAILLYCWVAYSQSTPILTQLESHLPLKWPCVEMTYDASSRLGADDPAGSYDLNDFSTLQFRLLAYRVCMQRIRFPAWSAPMCNPQNFLASLLNSAVKDSLLNRDPALYKTVLECTRGPELQFAYESLLNVRERAETCRLTTLLI